MRLSRVRYSLLLVVPALWCLLEHFDQLAFMERRLLDLRFQIRGERSAPPKVVYVDIDNQAIQAYRWPWNHSRYAQLTDALFTHGKVKAIGFDVLFSENSRPDFGIEEQNKGRLQFGKSIHTHKDVVLAANYVPGPGLLQKKRKFPWIFEDGEKRENNDNPELPAYPILGPSWGIPGLIDTYAGEARLAPVFADAPVSTFYPMALQLALIHWGLTEDALIRKPDRMEVRKPDGTLVTSIPLQRGQLVESNWFSGWISPENPRCSVADIGNNLTLLDDPDPDKQEIGRQFFSQFTNAIVLVGAVDPLLQDLGRTPFDKHPVPQVGFHGNLLKTLISGEYPHRLPSWGIYAITTFLTISSVSLALYRGRDRVRFKLASLLLLTGYVGLSCWLFSSANLVLPLAAPLGSTVMTGILALGWQVIDEQQERNRIQGLFGTYVSPELVEKMVETGETPQLGGVETEITAYFSDIQGFSKISEMLPPDRLVELMNEYLTACTDVILAEQGALDKYFGDAIVTMFGGLTPLKDHAYRACLASQLVQLRMEEMKKKWRSEGDKWPPEIHSMQSRIGLNSGPAIIGNMGSPSRFNFTMMGDNVNLAARMESGAKTYGVTTMVTEATRSSCLEHGTDRVVFRVLDRIVVKGRTAPVSIHEIVGLRENLSAREFDCIDLYEQGLRTYQEMDWQRAEKLFQKSASLEANRAGFTINPSTLMLQRCATLRDNPPPRDWNGVFVMRSK